MGLFDWSPIYEVGVPAIDGQHRRLLGYLNEMFQAMVTDRGAVTVGVILDALLAYAGDHFGNEEQILRLGGVDSTAHHKLHEELTARVVNLRIRHAAGEAAIDAAAIELLRGWLMDHILNEDSKYAAEMRRGAALLASGSARVPQGRGE